MNKTCNGLINENYDYHLWNDNLKYCKCVITNERCIGVTIADPDDQSSQFFLRGKNIIVEEKMKRCPLFGFSVETFKTLMLERLQRDLEEKMSQIE